MAYTNIYKGIVFIEGTHKSAILGNNIAADLSFCFGAQLKSLKDVKEVLSEQAKHYGYNAVVNFTYGQKSRFLAIDDIAFWGKGTLAKIPDDEYINLCQKYF